MYRFCSLENYRSVVVAEMSFCETIPTMFGFKVCKGWLFCTYTLIAYFLAKYCLFQYPNQVFEEENAHALQVLLYIAYKHLHIFIVVQ